MFITILVVLIPVIAAYIFTQWQINEMWNAEKEKRIIAIQSLILELEYNKDLVNQYIEHCEKGAHLGAVTAENKDIYTWELVSPNFENYKNLALACYSDVKLAKDITEIYSGLEECKIIVNQILQFWGNNLVIKETVINGKNLLKHEIIKYNGYLLASSKKIITFFESSINQLDSMRHSLQNGIQKDKERLISVLLFLGIISLIVIVPLIFLKFLPNYPLGSLVIPTNAGKEFKMNELIPYIFGYIFALLGGFFIIKTMTNLKEFVRLELSSENNRKSLFWYAQIVGFIEVFIYLTAFLNNYGQFIGVWLAFKVLGRWESAKMEKDQLKKQSVDGAMDDEKQKIRNNALYNIFTIGNALPIIYAFVGSKIIIWIQLWINNKCSLCLNKSILLVLLIWLGNCILYSLSKTQNKRLKYLFEENKTEFKK